MLLLTFSPVKSKANEKQGIVKGFTDSGFKTAVHALSSFHESYGLEADEDEGQDDDDEEGGSEDGSEEGSEEEK